MLQQKLLAITLITALALFATTVNSSFAKNVITDTTDKTINTLNNSTKDPNSIKTICYKAIIVDSGKQKNAIVCTATTVQLTK